MIPATVSDQIRLWEMERDRLELSEGLVCVQLADSVEPPKFKEHKHIGVVDRTLQTKDTLGSCLIYILSIIGRIT